MPGRVLVVGEALVDVRDDVRVRSRPRRRSEHPGGSPLNVAVALARLGIATTLAAQVGDDPRGDAIAAHVAASGVDLLRLPPTRRTATATARIGANGQPAYRFDLGWDPHTLPDPSGFAAVHVGSIAAALPPGADAVAELVAAAVAAGVPVSLDPNVRPQVTTDLADVCRRTDVAASVAAVVKLSDEDAAVLHPGVPVAQVVADLARPPSVRLCVLTLGATGLLVSTGGRPVPVPAPAVRVVDTIGAGDTVTAGLLAGLLTRGLLDEGATVRDCDAAGVGRLAVRAAALSCARPGADPPWRHELDGLDRIGSDSHP